MPAAPSPPSGSPCGRAAYPRRAPRRVDRLDRRHVGVVPWHDPRDPVIADQDDDRRRVGIAHQPVDGAERAGDLTGGQPRQPGRLLRRRAARTDRLGGRHRRQERRGGQGIAQLLAQDRQLDGAQALATVLLGDRDPRPAEPDQLGPQRVVIGLAFRGLADLGERRARAEQIPRRALDLVLVLGEVEIHAAAPFNRGRPRTRSATMFLRISVVPPSIVLPRERSSS